VLAELVGTGQLRMPPTLTRPALIAREDYAGIEHRTR
jgi:hypothetical protein